MHVIYTLARFYPYWTIPAIVILVEVGIFFKRKNSHFQYFIWGTLVLLTLGLLSWFIFRGDKNSDQWVTIATHFILNTKK